MSRELNKLPWERPQLRSERVHETLAKPACQFKPPGHGGSNAGYKKADKPPGGGWGPAFS